MRFALLLISIVIAGFLLAGVFGILDNTENYDYSLRETSTMELSSTAFKQGGSIPAKYTCDGDNINPPLVISGVPEETKSLALIVDDPDAPVGLWVHWTLWGVAPGTTEIAEGSVPEGAVEGMTSFGKSGFGGPCPPDGEHHYFFKVFALDTELDLDPESGKEALEEAMIGHVLDKAELIGLYRRK